MATAAAAVCPPPAKATSNGAFQGDNPLDFALPLLILQMCLVFVVTRGLAVLLRPLRQPRVIAEIIGGILLGPSALGRNTAYLHTVFPPRSLTVLDTVANLGLLFFLFLVGLELDMKAVTRTGKRALGIAFAGISLPFALGIGTSFVLRATISKGVPGPAFLVFMGVALSITAFPVLARILAELKLLTTDVGRLAMSAAAVNDVVAWILLALAISLSGTGGSPLVTLWVLLSGLLFVVCAVFVFRPIFAWMARRTPEGGQVDEIYVCATLTAVLAAGFVTDVIGVHALFGAFVLGILVPKEGPFAGALVEKVEDIVSGLFLPLYFVSSGLKTNVATIRGAQSWGLLLLVISTACLGKILGTFAVTFGCGVSCRESLTLGILMNTKGLVELIVLNIGKDRKVLNDQTFAVMVLMALFTTFITTPLVTYIYKPARRGSALYEHRTIERKDAASQLRILACFHSTRNIPTLINLVECSRGSARREKLCFYALHLTELSERSSAILRVQKARKNGRPFWNKTPPGTADSGQHVVAFEAFRRLSSVSVRPMTAISALSDIHEDICSSAEGKTAAIVILPFHKHQRLDGTLEASRPELRGVNQRVLERAPCSVGVLVDRGLGGVTHVSASNVSLSVTCVFFGGPDDREALSYGIRMAEHPGIRLTVLRLLVTSDEQETSEITVESDGDASPRRLGSGGDEDVPDELRSVLQNQQDGRDVVQYVEKAVAGAGEVVEAIRSFSRCDLLLAGRKPGGGGAVSSPVLGEWDEFPELGPVGSLLTSQGFPARASVLVVQQYSRSAGAVSPAALVDGHHGVQIPEAAGDSE